MVLPPEWMSNSASQAGRIRCWTKWAIISVTEPSRRPGNARFMLTPSMGETRAPPMTAA